MNRASLASTLLLACGLAAGRTLAADGPAAVSPELSTTASPLSKEERDWIENEVAPLATDEEKKIYLALAAPYQRREFREEFWKLREKEGLNPPYGPGFKSLYEDRLSTANEKYGGWRSDAGRVILALGEPGSVVAIDCPSVYRPIEIWTVVPASGQTTPPRLIFYRNGVGAPLRLWTPEQGAEVLLSPAVGNRGTFVSVIGSHCGPRALDRPCENECDVLYPAYASLQGQGSLGALSLLAAFTRFPPPPQEDWLTWRSRFVSAGARTEEEKRKIELSAPKAQAPSTPARKLASAERKKLEAALPERYREWLEEVALIITDSERDVFLQIADAVEREKFIEEFWRRRSIDRDGIRTNFREVYRDRVEYAKESFRNLNSDAAKVYILNGPPDAVIPINCEDVYVPIRIWYYERLEALRSKVYLIFYKKYGMGDWTMWLPIDGVEKLSIGGGAMNFRSNASRCFDSRTLEQAISFETAALGPGASGMAEAAKMFVPPPVQTEGIDRFLGLTTQVDPGAATLPIDKRFSFPEERDNKIACDFSLLVARKDLALRDVGDEKFFDIDVVGEVIHEDRLIDNFKYRFDIPIEEGAEQIPITMRRYLYPGKYELRLKAADANRKAEGRIVEALAVPETPDAPPVPAAAAAARVSNPPRDSGFRPSAISILPPAKEILTGLTRFETRSAEGITAVDFYLDGTKIMTRTRTPFDADLNLGPLPRHHAVRVTAYDRQGRLVGEDELTVNEGSEAFRVKIVSPPRGSHASGPTNVTADATAPEGRRIVQMDFYSNELKVATLFQPPWQQVVAVKSTGSLGYVRVVGTLDDGLVSEDLRYVNAPEYISEVNVDAVELYTTVTDHNRLVDGLTATNFKILEDGATQQIAQFERVTNLPLTVGVAVDTSASMIESLPEAEKAAIEFLEATIGAKDRAFTMSFEDSPYTLCRLTGNKERLERSFAGLRAEGSTALYDAIVYALFQFQGVKGKKTLVLVTDGKDTSSKYEFDTLLDYVKKAGVSIYAIGLKIPKAELEVKSKLNRMAEASGGSTFYIDSAKRLADVYRQINTELRTQYLLTYYSTNTAQGNKWRHVDVKTSPSNLLARTISGYYP